MTPEERREMLQKISDELEEAAKPVDLEALEEKGLIRKNGAWYEVLNLNALPDALRIRISEIQSMERGVKVKLKKRNPFEKLSRDYKQLLE
ncbi:MAG: hypothetical protein Tsb002_37180 [Wenzhouxiangellaceae bacterium]